MTYDDELIVDAARDLGDRLGQEAAYQRTVPDPEECLDLYENDYDAWYEQYRPQYGPLSGKSGGLTEHQIRVELGLQGLQEEELLNRVFDAFEEGFNDGWDGELLEEAREAVAA